MKKSLVLTLLVILLVGMVLPSVAMASDVEKAQEQLNSINESKKNVEEKLLEKKDEQKEVKDELEEIEEQLEKANQELKTTETELDNINNSLEEARDELAAAEKAMEEQSIAYGERMRAMYKNGTMGYLEVLLDSKSFSDFVSRLEIVKSIMEYDFELLTTLEKKRDEIEEKRRTIEEEQQRMITLKNQLENKAKEVQSLQTSRESYLRKVNAEIAAFEKEMEQLEQDSAAAKQIIQGSQSSTGGQSSSSSGLLWPVPGRTYISSPYGWRIHPISKTRKFHTGIDIPAPTGYSFVAPADGKVVYSGWLGGYGNVVMVDLGGGISILGAHNSKLLVSVGQSVSKGQTIAKIGTTGNSTGPHSHFEVRKNGNHVDPLGWVNR